MSWALQWSRGSVTTETPLRSRIVAPNSLLQWSRGSVTTETKQVRYALLLLSKASMEPWFGNHGNRHDPAPPRRGATCFNGAVVR